MEGTPMANNFDRRPISRSQTRAVKWVKEWVPQDVVATGGKCYLLKWVTVDVVKALKEKENEPEKPEPEPEPTSEVLFLCSYEGCGKTFIDAGALRKHSHIHGERQYVCHWEGCGKKFLDSSKLKRHFLIHTGERDFICPHEGCGKAFSLDFNLRSHMKTHSQENYHICPYPECGKRYAHEYKLKNHIASYHEKNAAEGATKYSTPPPEKPAKASKPSSGNAYASAPSADRPYACPYEGCGKAYIHEYKLNLHLRREHPSHYADENHHRPTTHKTSQPTMTMDHVATTSNNNHNFSHHRMDHHREMVADEASDQEAYLVGAKRGSISSNLKSSKKAKVAAMAPNVRLPPLKIARKGNNLSASPASMNMIKKPSSWALQDEVYGGEGEDSEETEEDRGDAEDGWRYGDNDNDGDDDDDDDDDEETEDED